MPGLCMCVSEECDRRTITATVETSNVRIHPCMLSYYQHSKDCHKQNPLSEDVVKLDVWYDENRVEQSLQVLRMDKTMLLNSIGGALGFFLGLSMNSVFAMLLDGVVLGIKSLKVHRREKQTTKESGKSAAKLFKRCSTRRTKPKRPRRDFLERQT